MKLLVFINKAPWNELLLRKAQDWKLGGNKVNHVGLVLLQTSKGVDWLGMGDNYKELRGSYPWSTSDGEEAVRNLARSIPKGALVGACMFRCVDANSDGTNRYEYQIDGPRRFPHPIPFSQSGPVRFNRIEVTAEIEKQLRAVGLWRVAQKHAA